MKLTLGAGGIAEDGLLVVVLSAWAVPPVVMRRPLIPRHDN